MEGQITSENFDTVKEYGEKYEDIPDRVPNVDKAEKVLNWRAPTSVTEGIRKFIAWARSNQWWIDKRS